MSVRFRIRTAAGQELSFASPDMFEDFVRSGDLSPDDLVYDGESGSWAPARTHPIVLEIEYEREAEAEAAQKAEEAEAAPGPAEDPASADDAFGLTLANATEAPPEEEPESQKARPRQPAEELAAAATAEKQQGDTGATEDLGLELAPVEERSAEEEKRAFVEQLEAERKDELDFQVPDAGMEGFHMESASVISEMVRSEPTPPPPPPEPEPLPARTPPKRGKIKRAVPKQAGKGKRIGVGVGTIGVLGVAAFIGMRFLGGTEAIDLGPAPDSASVTPVDTPPEPPPRVPVIANTEDAVRERAQERFLTSTQSLLRDLQPIPEVWPRGEYLSAPSEHADVLDVWQSYLATIQDVRAGDADRYQTAYETALDDAVIEGDERTERLSAALTDFVAEQELRDAHYDRVEALANAAISSHAAVLEADGLIIYDATGATGAQSGIALGTYGRDTDSQFRLDQVIELLDATLAADGLGPGDGASVREWVWDGFLDAVAN